MTKVEKGTKIDKLMKKEPPEEGKSEKILKTGEKGY